MAQVISPNEIASAVETLTRGGLVAFPTETVYGLGADATNAAAAQRIFEAKGRPSSNPLILHVHSFDSLLQWCAFERASDPTLLRARINALRSEWPGPLSIIVPRPDSVPSVVSGGGDTVALRIPNHPIALELIERFGRPVAAPSANISNYVSPTTAAHVQEGLGSKVELIIDGGQCSVGLESTVLSLVHPQPTILRPGAVTRERIEELLKEPVLTQSAPQLAGTPQLSPGLLAKHYSPSTPVVLYSQLASIQRLPARVGAIRFSSSPPPFSAVAVRRLSEDMDINAIASGLFSALRDLDKLNLDLIVVDECEPIGLGAAVMDRLLRVTSR